MSRYPALKRQLLIVDYIDGQYRTKEQIIDYLKEKDFKADKRTLTRDFNDIEDYFECEIDRNPKRGHIFNDQLAFRMDLLNRFRTIDRLNKIMGQKTELLEFVLDSLTEIGWVNLIPDLFKALQERRYIEFDYKKHGESEYFHKEVIPLWLKEDQNFWYLIGLPTGEKSVKIFGLDRMKDFKLKDIYDGALITESVREQKDIYNYILGVSYPTFDKKKPEKELIELAVSDFLLNYWKSKPMHPTQRITTEKIDGYTKVTFWLIPNIDLIKLVVSGLGDIKLIGPMSLKEHIKKNYKGLMTDIF